MQRNTDGAPYSAPRFFSRKAAGWTLFELTIVLVVAAGMVFFAVRTFRPAEALALEQAERLRNDLRQAQMHAITWGQALRVTIPSATSYSIACVTAGTPPCDAATVVALEQGLILAGPALDFDTLGRPVSGGSLITANAVFTISGGGGVSRTVTIAPVTGFGIAQ